MSKGLGAFLASSPLLVAAGFAWALGESWYVVGIMLVSAAGVAIGYLNGASTRR